MMHFSPLPSSPTRAEGLRCALCHGRAIHRSRASLPPVWGRAGVGGRHHINQTPPTKVLP